MILPDARKKNVDFIDATNLATALHGNSIATNMFLLGCFPKRVYANFIRGNRQSDRAKRGSGKMTRHFMWGRRLLWMLN